MTLQHQLNEFKKMLGIKKIAWGDQSPEEQNTIIMQGVEKLLDTMKEFAGNYSDSAHVAMNTLQNFCVHIILNVSKPEHANNTKQQFFEAINNGMEANRDKVES